MNKKKKKSRIKHRKNQVRVKNLLKASLLKAKPKKKIAEPIKKDLQQKAIVKESTTKKPAAKKTAAKKDTK